MEIALNRESKRKTPSVVAFRDGTRTFGEDAQTLGLRFPATSYGYLIDLLGKTIDNPIVQLYKYVAAIDWLTLPTTTTCYTLWPSPNFSLVCFFPGNGSLTMKSWAILSATPWSL